MSVLRRLYLALALWGAIHPMALFLWHMADSGAGLAGLVTAWQANAATSGLAWDLVIASIALTVWIIAETLVRKNWSALLALPATYVFGLGCGLPLYLFLRTRPV